LGKRGREGRRGKRGEKKNLNGRDGRRIGLQERRTERKKREVCRKKGTASSARNGGYWVREGEGNGLKNGIEKKRGKGGGPGGTERFRGLRENDARLAVFRGGGKKKNLGEKKARLEFVKPLLGRKRKKGISFF